MNTRKIALSSILLATALAIGVIENLIPPIFPFLPYVKIGFSNIVIIVAILLLNWKYAAIIITLKAVFVPIFVGNPIMILYSLPASLLSTAVSAFLLYSKKPGIPLISIVSAIVHNLSQLCVACIMTNYLVFGYVPYFLIIGILSGLVTGIIAYFPIKYLPENLLG